MISIVDGVEKDDIIIPKKDNLTIISKMFRFLNTIKFETYYLFKKKFWFAWNMKRSQINLRLFYENHLITHIDHRVIPQMYQQ